MPDPTRIALSVRDVTGSPLLGAGVGVVVRRGVEWSDPHPRASAPVVLPLRAGFIQVEVDVTAPDYVPERVVLTFVTGQQRWQTTNPAAVLTHDGDTARLELVLGRVALAPIATVPDDTMVAPDFNPGAVLATPAGYRTIHLGLDVRIRVLAPIATGNPDDVGWDRFRWHESYVRLADRGNWLVLEYGDTSGRPDALRHLLGVWAPHTFVGAVPPVVVQVTPNTRAPYYPADRRPFTGRYPYACLPAAGTAPVKGTGMVRLRDMRQPYVELPANRCLGQYKVLYQLYAARPDLFDGPNGPIVITPSPALIEGAGPLRAPFDHRDGLGRMVAEVLRFLVARMLTLPTTGSMRLRFQGTRVTMWGQRPVVAPTGVPPRTITTVLCHSAGVAPVLTLAASSSQTRFPDGFPVNLWGGTTPHGDASWRNLWVVDGVATPGGIGVPSGGGDAARTWAGWLRREGRRLTMVYTPSGLGGPVAPELVKGAVRRSGRTGWVEESVDGRVRWLQMSYDYLRSATPGTPKDVVPALGALSDNAEQVHNKVYEVGVGYAAGTRP